MRWYECDSTLQGFVGARLDAGFVTLKSRGIILQGDLILIEFLHEKGKFCC